MSNTYGYIKIFKLLTKYFSKLHYSKAQARHGHSCQSFEIPLLSGMITPAHHNIMTVVILNFAIGISVPVR
jgi:hypothetical protein